MVRAAAKNHDHVGVVVDPADYDAVLDELRQPATLSRRHADALARAAFAHTAAYDAAIVAWFDGDDAEPCCRHAAPALERADVLRYGENPHQRGARYRVEGTARVVGRRRAARRLGAVVPEPLRRRRGLALVHDSARPDRPAPRRCIIKHANPCGAAVADDLAEAYRARARRRRPSRLRRGRRVGGPWTPAPAESIAAGPRPTW